MRVRGAHILCLDNAARVWRIRVDQLQLETGGDRASHVGLLGRLIVLVPKQPHVDHHERSVLHDVLTKPRLGVEQDVVRKPDAIRIIIGLPLFELVRWLHGVVVQRHHESQLEGRVLPVCGHRRSGNTHVGAQLVGVAPPAPAPLFVFFDLRLQEGVFSSERIDAVRVGEPRRPFHIDLGTRGVLDGVILRRRTDVGDRLLARLLARLLSLLARLLRLHVRVHVRVAGLVHLQALRRLLADARDDRGRERIRKVVADLERLKQVPVFFRKVLHALVVQLLGKVLAVAMLWVDITSHGLGFLLRSAGCVLFRLLALLRLLVFFLRFLLALLLRFFVLGLFPEGASAFAGKHAVNDLRH